MTSSRLHRISVWLLAAFFALSAPLASACGKERWSVKVSKSQALYAKDILRAVHSFSEPLGVRAKVHRVDFRRVGQTPRLSSRASLAS